MTDSVVPPPAPATPALYQAAGLRAIEIAAAEQPLMQRAGLAAADWAVDLVADRQAPILVLAGPGNNGGDGFEMATHLLRRDHDVRLLFAGEAEKLPVDAAAARARYLAAGGNELTDIPGDVRWALIVDALLGIGLQRPLSGRYATLVDAANQLAGTSRCPLLALDCPSGLDADTGSERGMHVIHASHTITFIALKPGLLTANGPDHCGQLRLATLDLAAEAIEPAAGHIVVRADFAEHLHVRRRNSHKGSYGSAGIVGGAPGMLGAAYLAGRAALHLGAGRVYLGTVDPAAPACDPAQPELMLRDATALLRGAAALTALACGPGLGHDPAQVALVETACALDLPLLLDADALNLLAREGNLNVAVASRSAPTLLTPHPAEAARLLASDVVTVQSDRITAARELAAQFNAHIALKGCGTVVATPDGRWWINTTGNPGMAAAGMGDVLSGIVVALLAQGWPAAAALAAGVHLHGAAADDLARTAGEVGLTAGETILAARRLLNRWISTNE